MEAPDRMMENESFDEYLKRVRSEGLRKIFAERYEGGKEHSIYDVYGLHGKGLSDKELVEVLEDILQDIQNDGEYVCRIIYECDISDITGSVKKHQMNGLRIHSDVRFTIYRKPREDKKMEPNTEEDGEDN